LTAAEYRAAYDRARRTWPKLTAATMREIRDVYLESANKLAEILRSGSLDDKSKITQAAARQMEAEFERAAKAIQASIVEEVPLLISRGYDGFSKIEVEFMTDALEGIDQGKVTEKGLQNVYVGVNQRVVETTLHRVGQDGYTFAQRAGRAAGFYQQDMNRLIAAGFAQGRDLAKIAEDLTKYVTDGKIKTVKRWGEILEPESKALLKRVPERVDYRALRIARSELASSLQEGARQNGKINPGALNEFDWVLTNEFHASGDPCPDLAANSPYAFNEVPAYPHPNCECWIRPRLKPAKEFRDELLRWADGGNSPDVNEWYSNVYRPAQARAA